MTHELKCHPAPFQASRDGIKTFEYRYNDRGFTIGDTLKQLEWQPVAETLPLIGSYTGCSLFQKVTYCLYGPQFGIPEGYCVMSVELIKYSK